MSTTPIRLMLVAALTALLPLACGGGTDTPVDFTGPGMQDQLGGDRDAAVVPPAGSDARPSGPEVTSSGPDAKTIVADTAPPPPTSPYFIMGSRGDGTTKEPQSLVKVMFSGGKPQITALTELYPDGMRRDYLDFRKGRVAMVIPGALMPTGLTGRGRIVAFDVATPSTRWFVPVPTATKGYYYDIGAMRPQVLDDGRVVVMVSHQTDTVGDDYTGEQLAIWDPVKDTIEVQGLLDSWVLAQPEVSTCNCDAEGGHMAGSAFAVTRDGRYAFFSAMSSGTDMMVHHGGPGFLIRWDMVGKLNERMFYTNSVATPWAVTADNTMVIVAHDGLEKTLSPTAKTLTKFDDYTAEVQAGQVAGRDFIKSWRGCDYGAYGGVVLLHPDGTAGIRVLDGEKLPSPHRGVSEMSQITSDGKLIYLPVSTDHCTNYASPFAVFQVAVAQENTANALKLGEMDPKYTTSIFILIQ